MISKEAFEEFQRDFRYELRQLFAETIAESKFSDGSISSNEAREPVSESVQGLEGDFERKADSQTTTKAYTNAEEGGLNIVSGDIQAKNEKLASGDELKNLNPSQAKNSIVSNEGSRKHVRRSINKKDTETSCQMQAVDVSRPCIVIFSTGKGEKDIAEVRNDGPRSRSKEAEKYLRKSQNSAETAKFVFTAGEKQQERNMTNSLEKVSSQWPSLPRPNFGQGRQGSLDTSPKPQPEVRMYPLKSSFKKRSHLNPKDNVSNHKLSSKALMNESEKGKYVKSGHFSSPGKLSVPSLHCSAKDIKSDTEWKTNTGLNSEVNGSTSARAESSSGHRKDDERSVLSKLLYLAFFCKSFCTLPFIRRHSVWCSCFKAS